ncbi:MAG: hypothetical protein ACLP62_14965 [Acidimicrobiales bacterium]
MTVESIPAAAVAQGSLGRLEIAGPTSFNWKSHVVVARSLERQRTDDLALSCSALMTG